MILLTNEWIGWTANGLRVFDGNLVTSINNNQKAANTQNPSMFQLRLEIEKFLMIYTLIKKYK